MPNTMEVPKPEPGSPALHIYNPPVDQAHPLVGVVVATLHPDLVDGKFFESWNFLRQYDHAHCNHTAAGSAVLATGPRVAQGRTDLVRAYLEDPGMASAEWLWCIDSDMTFDEDMLCTLLEIAYTHADGPNGHIKVIAPLCFAGGKSRMYPTIFEEVQTDYGLQPQPVSDFPENALLNCAATGGAGLLVHRSVFEHMARPYNGTAAGGFGTLTDGRPAPYPWFVEGHNNQTGIPVGEDVAFCVRARACGYGIWVYTGIEMGHRKHYELNSQTWREYNDRNQQLGESLRQGRELILPNDSPFSIPGVT